MAGHTSEKRWRTGQFQTGGPGQPGNGQQGVSLLVSNLCTEMLKVLTTSRAAHLELLEMFQFAGGTIQLLADQLFYEDWSTRLANPGIPGVYETEANAEEVQKVQDMSDAVTALNEIHQCADNVAVPAEDRYAQLRRMS